MVDSLGRTVVSSRTGLFSRENLIERVDLSSGLGPELVTNGSFTTDTAWNKNANWSIAGGVALSDGSSSLDINQSTTLAVIGKEYRVEYEVVGVTQGLYQATFGGIFLANRSSVGTFTETIIAISTDRIRIHARSLAIGSIDNVSIREVL